MITGPGCPPFGGVALLRVAVAFAPWTTEGPLGGRSRWRVSAWWPGFLISSLWWAAAVWWTWLGGSLLVGLLTWILVFELMRLRRGDD
jgi:hypothetical protein